MRTLCGLDIAVSGFADAGLSADVPVKHVPPWPPVLRLVPGFVATDLGLLSARVESLRPHLERFFIEYERFGETPIFGW